MSDFDSFAPEADTGAYSQEKFYTRASDRRGHVKTWRYGPKNEVLTVPPELHGMLMVLRDQWAEYRTNGDIMRDALIHLFHMRIGQARNPTMAILNQLQKATAIAHLEALTATMEADERLLEHLRFLADNSKDSHTKKEVRNMVFDVLITAEGEHLRSELEKIQRNLT
jgi:hypothetical protein